MRRSPHAVSTTDPDPTMPAEVGHWIDHWAALQPDALAWADDTRRCCWREAADRVGRLAGWLERSGVRRGDRVALWLANRSAVLETIFAGARIGAIVLPINARLTAAEVAFQLQDSAPRVLVVERSFRERSAQAIAQSTAPAPLCLELGEPATGSGESSPCAYERALAEAPPANATGAERRCDPEDPMILMYTSGTTGEPKGALLPQRKTLYNCRNARACFGTTRSDRVLVVTPLFHSLGLQILALPAIYAGAAVVIQEGFDPVRAWRAVEAEGITYLGAVPTAHQRLLDALGPQPPASLRFVFTAGAAAPIELIRAYHRRGIAMIQGYGQTETSLLTCLAADKALKKAGSVGHPLPHAEIRLVEPASLEGAVAGWRDVPVGAVGEIVVRGPITMLGYWRRPEATRETLREEWIRTGDLATRDEDFDITLVGRAREMYISGGENVYPAEVEAVLERHPSIAEAAVVAVPDAQWGEVGRAHLVARPNATIDLSELASWLDQRLARYKQPRAFLIEQSLPRTASGKVQKHRLLDPDAVTPR
jgi:acyl-CoA synthetase (AMP-forming)/AMP-acid ligase II